MKGNWELTRSDFKEYCKINGIDYSKMTNKDFNRFKNYQKV